jgi:large subunit ribosomal protein L29
MSTKVNEIRQLDVNEMRQKIEASEKELYDLRYQANTSQVEKPHRIKKIRREIAVYKTIIREKELANAKR